MNNKKNLSINERFKTYDKFFESEMPEMPETHQSFYFLVPKKTFMNPPDPIGKLIKKVRNFLFSQIPVTDNILKRKFDENTPVLNYGGNREIVQKLIDKEIISEDCMYNMPDQCELAASKVKFHKALKDILPKTAFSLSAAKKLKFPVIGKPDYGVAGGGILKFDTIEDLESEGFDLYSEFIDIKREFRCFCFRDEILVLNERIKIKDAEDFLEDKDIKTEFYYKELRSYRKRDEVEKMIKKCLEKIELDVYSMDFAEDKDGKLHLIEMNSATGMGVSKMHLVYEKIHADFHRKELTTDLKDIMAETEKEWEKLQKEKEKTT